MTTMPFQEKDPDGEKTLEVISKADKFNRWMFRTIEPYCTGRVLEIGSGIGNISAFFLEQGYSIMLSDIRIHYTEALKNKFSHFPNLQGAVNIDLVDPDFREKYKSMNGYFDTVFALNVVEHIDDDKLAVQNCRFLLREGGNLIILVPAYMALYNQFDKNLGHFRRYTKNSLESLISGAGFEILHRQYFNLAGILGWYFSGSILRKQTIPEGQMGLYNLLVPVFRIVDKLIQNKAGLSVIIAGRAR